MKNIYEVLRQKEQEIQQLQRDIEALRVAARLLADENDTDATQRSVSASVQTARVTTAGAVTAVPTPGIRQFP